MKNPSFGICEYKGADQLHCNRTDDKCLNKIILEFLGETRLTIIILQIIIIGAGTPLVSNSFHFSWNPKYIKFWDQYILVSS